MVRPLRIEYEDAYYHVMNRGRGRQRVFPNVDYYRDYLKCLDEAHKRFGIEIHAYCLMDNHYHLLVKTPRGNLGRSMRHIDGVYTQRHNRRKKPMARYFEVDIRPSLLMSVTISCRSVATFTEIR